MQATYSTATLYACGPISRINDVVLFECLTAPFTTATPHCYNHNKHQSGPPHVMYQCVRSVTIIDCRKSTPSKFRSQKRLFASVTTVRLHTHGRNAHLAFIYFSPAPYITHYITSVIDADVVCTRTVNIHYSRQNNRHVRLIRLFISIMLHVNQVGKT